MFFSKSDAPVLDTNQKTSTEKETTNPKVNGVSVDVRAQMETGVLNQNKVVVTYNGTAFSPKAVTIKKGDSITFVNESAGGMSVASDPHPSHTIYPEFDQYKSTERGQKSFTFVFDKVGSWAYHNHLNSSATGLVVVE